MKRFLVGLGLFIAANFSMAADVGVSISIGEPGFFGRLDIGNTYQPVLVNRQPVIIEKVKVVRQPIYLRVPLKHSENWPKYCGRYHACGERVYFVEDKWYTETYAPAYKKRGHAYGHDKEHGKSQDKGKRNKHGRHDD